MTFRWVAIILVLITIGVYFLQLSIPNLTDNFALVSAAVWQKPWALISYMFLHSLDDPAHIIYNMFGLALFGSILERVVGWKNFLITYFISGILAGIGSIFFYESVIGASGAIFGVMGSLGVLRPRMTVFVSYVPMPMALAVVVWGLGNLFAIGGASVAYNSHLVGLATGLILGLILRKGYKETLIKRDKNSIDDREFRIWESRYMKLSQRNF